jgi:hypothetical protein
MRYMYLISAVEDGKPPPQRLMDEIGKQAEQELASGRMLSQGGLLPTVMGAARVTLKQGKLSVLDGPFSESKEVLGGFAIFDFATREEALASLQSFMELHREHWPDWEGVCEMRPMFGFGATAAAFAE